MPVSFLRLVFLFMNLNRLLNEYLEYSKVFKSSGTYRYDKNHLGTIVSYLLNKKYQDTTEITFNSLYDFIDYSRSRENTNKTINKRIAILNRAIMFFVKRDMCEPSVIAGFPKLKETDKRYEVVNEKQMKLLIDYMMSLDESFMNTRNKLIVFLFIDTGMRLSELTNIKTQNIDLETQSILLTETKTKRERVVYFSDTTKRFIEQYINMIDDESAYLFRSIQYPNTPITYIGVMKTIQKIRDQIGLKQLSSHMIRHSYGTLAYILKISTLFTKNTMGHARVEMTERYTHYDIETNQKNKQKFISNGVLPRKSKGLNRG